MNDRMTGYFNGQIDGGDFGTGAGSGSFHEDELVFVPPDVDVEEGDLFPCFPPQFVENSLPRLQVPSFSSDPWRLFDHLFGDDSFEREFGEEVGSSFLLEDDIRVRDDGRRIEEIADDDNERSRSGGVSSLVPPAFPPIPSSFCAPNFPGFVQAIPPPPLVWCPPIPVFLRRGKRGSMVKILQKYHSWVARGMPQIVLAPRRSTWILDFKLSSSCDDCDGVFCRLTMTRIGSLSVGGRAGMIRTPDKNAASVSICKKCVFSRRRGFVGARFRMSDLFRERETKHRGVFRIRFELVVPNPPYSEFGRSGEFLLMKYDRPDGIDCLEFPEVLI